MASRPGRVSQRVTLDPTGRPRGPRKVDHPGAAHLAERGEIARGGMGVVRRVFDTRMERTVALKVIEPALATHPEALGRFLDEARITAQLDHPNIVPVHEMVVDDNGLPSAFVMKLVDGETLTAHIHRDGRRELTRLLEIFLKVCDAVAFAHSRGVIHRDLKPDNIMIGEFGQVYVMDWGCAHVTGGKRRAEGRPRRSFVEARGTVIGTPGYMAPEQAWGRTDDIDERTDVFGLGAILYHVLTGAATYPGDTTLATVASARKGAATPPQDVVGEVRLPPGLCRIAMRALAVDPDERYASVEELRGEIEGFLRGGSYFDSQTFAPGELIVREGDSADVAYVITAGHCEAFRKERGRRVALRVLGPGDVFGEGAIFAAGTRNASVVALDEVTAIAVSRASLHEELAIDSWMGAFVRALAIRYRDIEARRRVTSLANDHLRITSTIIEHLARAGTWTGKHTLAMPWSRLWATVGSELHLTEEHALELISRTSDLLVDLDRDAITLSVPEG